MLEKIEPNDVVLFEPALGQDRTVVSRSITVADQVCLFELISHMTLRTRSRTDADTYLTL